MDDADRFLDAVEKGDVEGVTALLETKPSLLATGRAGVSAVRLAVYHGHPDVARLLVERGAALDVFDASAVGAADRLRDLLAEDPSRANAVASDGFTPLGLAAFFGHEAAARLLLERGADPDLPARNATKVAPIHSAVAGGSVEIVRELLARGANVHARQQGGFTPLHGAAVEADREMIRVLLEHGADRDAKNDAGRTALDLAREPGREEAAALLLG
jgi:ankyrin repeat protein